MMNERISRVTDRAILETGPGDLCGVLVMLEVGGRQALLIRLGEDGNIHRLGAGTVDSVERDRYIGATDPETFGGVRSRITERLLDWCGQSRSHPAPRGEICNLILAFKRKDGQEVMMAWEYGTLSKWPPAEVLDFVDFAVEATRPWYEEQKKALRQRTQRSEYEWWRSFTVPHA